MFALGKLESKKILVIGDVMIDRYYCGSVTRISPEAPVPILKKENEFLLLGGSANTAVNLCFANQYVSIASIIGDDVYGDTLINMLINHNIDTTLVYKDKSRRTTIKTRILGQNNQQLFRIDEEDTNYVTPKTEEIFLNLLLPNIRRYSIIVISDYAKGVLTYNITKAVIETANQYNIKVVIDVKDRNIEKYRNAYLIKPNANELGLLTGATINSVEDVIVESKKLRELCNCEYVLTTQGAEGMTLVGKDNCVEHIKSIAKEVFDVTGAGDTVIAYLSVGIVNNYSITQSMLLANCAAGIKVSKVGTAPISIAEINECINNVYRNQNNSKIIELSELLSELEKRKLQKIIFTNGCFDILHLGHIKYLKEASRLGDILVVGVNSDSSVKRLKGVGRPIVHEYDRMSMLAMFDFIDYVVKFDEDTPLELIKKIRPDVLVKGGDYLSNEVIGKEFVESLGGELVLMPFEEGYSTTDIIKRIKNMHQGG